jgi:hypothetical protein
VGVKVGGEPRPDDPDPEALHRTDPTTGPAARPVFGHGADEAPLQRPVRPPDLTRGGRAHGLDPSRCRKEVVGMRPTVVDNSKAMLLAEAAVS